MSTRSITVQAQKNAGILPITLVNIFVTDNLALCRNLISKGRIMQLSEYVKQTSPAEDEIAIFYLAQAGFAIKNHNGTFIVMDPYLSDCCNRLHGFRRMIPPLWNPRELPADILIATHNHNDHLDIDALPTMVACPKTYFIAATDCQATLAEYGVEETRSTFLTPPQSCTVEDIKFRAIYADHGQLAPDAIGILTTVDGINIYNAADTALAIDEITESLAGESIDIMIAPINGAFGNLNPEQACQLAAAVKPKVLIASHFWMFLEHGGNPTEFLEIAKTTIPNINAIVMAPGERMIYSAKNNQAQLQCLPDSYVE